jgi:hypothetical protein
MLTQTIKMHLHTQKPWKTEKMQEKKDKNPRKI